MSLKIDNQLQSGIHGFNIEKIVAKLLRVVPKEDLVGLERIVIVDQITKEETLGIYKYKHNFKPTSIEISFKSIYKGMPKFLFFLPFIPKFLLADVLYHEIGHHYERNFFHGIGKKEREKFADNYGKKMSKKAFWGWLILLYPLSPLIKYLNRRSKGGGHEIMRKGISSEESKKDHSLKGALSSKETVSSKN